MIQNIQIRNFKSIENQTFYFKPLTILTGKNSSGKSSVIQAILFYINKIKEESSLTNYLGHLGIQKDLFFMNAKKKECFILPTINGKKMPSMNMIFDGDETRNNDISKVTKLIPQFEQDIFFLSANRIGQEDIANSNATLRCGVNGEFIFGFYEYNKNEPLSNKKLLSNEQDKLGHQVDFWLNKILLLNLALNTQAIIGTSVKVSYKNFDLDNLNGVEMSPFNLGAGVSYLAKILILGLSLKEGDILIVENPEVHLHPNAIANFAEFFAFLAQNGIQVILETHSEHILNKMRYFVFDKKSSLDKIQLSTDDVQIYYRENFDKEFIALNINNDGRYIDKEGKVVNFPTGFFDSVLNDLLEMF